MKIKVFPTKAALAEDAANRAAEIIRVAISTRGEARIIAATGAAQFEFLDVLTKIPNIDWNEWRCSISMSMWAYPRKIRQAFADI